MFDPLRFRFLWAWDPISLTHIYVFIYQLWKSDDEELLISPISQPKPLSLIAYHAIIIIITFFCIINFADFRKFFHGIPF
jgi:hypothetical protein